MKKQLPTQAKKYFWGDDLSQLNWHDHRLYITQTLLEKGDVDSVAWLIKQSSMDELLQDLPRLKLSAKSRNFWEIYLRDR
jgi:hypothetical protein